MKHLVISASLALLGLTSPAQAHMASFERAVTGICLAALPDLNSAPDVFRADGWDGFAGADPGEWEFHEDDTSVFLIAGAGGMQPGCTVTDEAPARLQAGWQMELWLDEYHEGMVAFTIQESMGGEGAAISFELRL